MFVLCEVKDDISNGEAILLIAKECLSLSHKPTISVVREDAVVLLSIQIGKYRAMSVKITFDKQYRDTLNELANNYLRDVVEFIHYNYNIIKSMMVMYYTNEED